MQVMQKHQKYFSVRDENGKLLPYFIAVRHAFSNMFCDVVCGFTLVIISNFCW